MTPPATQPADGNTQPPQQTTPPTQPEFVPYTDDAVKLDLPEGVEVDSELKTGFIALANEFKLSPDVVQKVVALQTESVKRAVEKQVAQWNAVQEQWRNEVQNHPKFGGEKLNPALGKISEFINTNSSNPEGFRQAIDQTGLGNNPLVVELLLKAAEAVSEGRPAAGAPQAGAQSLADKLYTTMKD